MQKTYTASKEIMAEFAEFADHGIAPWLVLSADRLLGIFEKRADARAAKLSGQRAIEKFDANTHFLDDSVPAPVVSKAKPIAQAIAEAEGKLGKVVAINPVAEAAAAVQAEEAANARPVEKKPKAKVASVELTEGQRTSTAERPTKAVWFIADEMRQSDPLARRKDIIAECQARGIAYFTARTQFQLWSNCQKEMSERVSAAAKAG
jgi:hypothetical protein